MLQDLIDLYILNNIIIFIELIISHGYRRDLIDQMADFSSLTHKFRANIDNQSNGSKVNKRNRQPLSCGPCRFKKLKCDRGHPCETCVKRGEPANCTYGKAAPVLSRSESNNNATSGRGKAQERLRHLEQLVMQMVNTSDPPSNNGNPSPPESDVTNSSIAQEGHLQYGSTESRYVGSTHWSAILQNIQELKTALGTEQTTSTELDETDDTEPQNSESLFGPVSHLSLAQILAQSLPPRLQVDRRLSTYFNSRYMVIPFIHRTQFQRQYEQFWRTPLETPPLWVSILFSICCMSAGLSEAVGAESSNSEDQPSARMTFLNAACQCLRLGGFLRPKRYVIEALALYTQCQYMAVLDPSGGVGLIWSILVRHAYRSGYHRDATHFPRFNVFEGEMRRRIWAMLRQFDLMISFQLGLPSQITPNSWDTLNPRNLTDTDFDEHTTVLPPSRPESEATEILYFIVKSRLMTSFGKVCAHALSFRNSTEKEIMDLDAEVRAVHKTVPDILRIKPMSQSFADPSYLIMVRLNCEFLFQKSICVLHRKYMTQGGYPASTEACIDAAVAITKHMLDLHKEFKPGGQLHADRWMLSSFTMNDFYLASMVLCLGLSMWKKANPGKKWSDDEKIESQYSLLKDAFGICEELSPSSTEARRIADVLRVVLGQMGSQLSIPATKDLLGSKDTSLGHFGVFAPISQLDRNNTSSMQGTSNGDSTMPYNFNLAPLSLDDQDNSAIRDSSSGSMEAQAQAQPDFSTFNYMSPNTGMAVDCANPHYLSPNAFTSFLPFSPSFQQATPYPQQTTLNPGTNDDANTGVPTAHAPDTAGSADINTNMPMPMDVDWTFLDQWMALPEPEILPMPETYNPNSPFFMPPTQRTNNSDLLSSDLAAASAEHQDWTSAPFKFLGGEILMNNARDEAAKQQRHGSRAQGWAPFAQSSTSASNGNGSASAQSNGQSTSASTSDASKHAGAGTGQGHVPQY
ncbi:fungal-specific transcription factor domain-containing protein [Exophiala viscosa]|uniref:Fungal-specific transcription factor domain-containing protein n=1 Tax=Exophiala viscosa TaxID=2486360 RepID=A0AAN6IA25_9EURO|nr:fungal-specific transcription factor domain-containing protein [Exophiala viscosa]